jgi:hypothetical protein
MYKSHGEPVSDKGSSELLSKVFDPDSLEFVHTPSRFLPANPERYQALNQRISALLAHLFPLTFGTILREKFG